MRKRTIARISAVIAAGLVVTGVAVIAATDREAVREAMARQLTDVLGRAVILAGPVEVEPGLHPVLVGHDLRLADPDGGVPGATAAFDRAEFRLKDRKSTRLNSSH